MARGLHDCRYRIRRPNLRETNSPAVPMASPSLLAAPASLPPGKRPVSLFRYDSTDVHEYCANLPGWSLDYDQLSTGPFRGSLTTIELPRLDIFREVTTRKLRQSGTLGADSFTIGIPWHASSIARCNGTTLSGADTFLLNIDGEIELYTPDDFELRGISAGASLMERLAAELGIGWPPHFLRRLLAVGVDAGRMARFRCLLCAAATAVPAGPTDGVGTPAIRALEDGLLLAILDLVASGQPIGRPGTAARKRTVDRARDLMLSLDGKAMTLLDICRQVGVSPRKLTYCFQEQLGISPAHFWKAIRLNRARKDLLAPTAGRGEIYDIATRHGFWHFSQFSQDYKRHFLERPSDTVAKARPRRVAEAAAVRQ